MSMKQSVEPPHARAHRGLRTPVFTQTAGAKEELAYIKFGVTTLLLALNYLAQLCPYALKLLHHTRLLHALEA